MRLRAYLFTRVVSQVSQCQNNYHGDSPARERAEAAAEAEIWECAGCRNRVIDARPPQMCRKCEKTRFTRVMRKAV